MTKPSRPHKVDVHLGQKLRVFRIMAGMTQAALADRLGMSHQQIQKYEKAMTPIISSKLYALAQILERDVVDFFDGLETAKPTTKFGIARADEDGTGKFVS